MSNVRTIEYVWLDGNNELRSKIRVLKCYISTVADIPTWNYDGSSTNQAIGTDSEVFIVPRAIFTDITSGHILTMCDSRDKNGEPISSNTRASAVKIFDKDLEAEPWFGLEQEYFLMKPKTCFDQTSMPIGLNTTKKQGQYYCSVGNENAFGRKIAESHMRMCINVGINISGMNAEVAPGQWEFQIGPCVGISAGDHLYMARYLLQKISEDNNVNTSFHPKPVKGDWNGSGCHTNYSTKAMREGTDDKSGLDHIDVAIERLSKKHMEHMSVYGIDNHLRMTGAHETASYTKFSSGIANRGASIRIGNETAQNKKGYFEDRRPSSNCDPYRVTSIIFETTVVHT